MNKAIIVVMIVLAAFIVVAQNYENDKANYNSQDFYKNEPVKNWNPQYIQADKIPGDKINELNGKQLTAIQDDLSSAQLKQLKSDQISSIIQEVDAQQLSKMNPSAVNSLSKTDAEKYFEDKLTSDGYQYELKNSNERKLLKKIDAFSKVNFKSMQNIDNVNVGNVKAGGTNGYNIETPEGTVFLGSAANVEHTGEGLKVTGSQGNGVVMTSSGAGKGTIHVNEQGYRMDSFEGEAPYKIMKDGETVCGVNPPYNNDISSGNPVYVGFGGEEPSRANYISVGEDTLKTKATEGDMVVNIIQDPSFENYQATAGKEGSIVTTLNKNGQEYKITTAPDKVLTKGESSPFPVSYNQVHNPEDGQGVKIKKGETKVRDMDGGWWSKVTSAFEGSSEEEQTDGNFENGKYATKIANRRVSVNDLKKEEYLPENDKEFNAYHRVVRNKCGLGKECRQMIDKAKQHIKNKD